MFFAEITGRDKKEKTIYRQRRKVFPSPYFEGRERGKIFK